MTPNDIIRQLIEAIDAKRWPAMWKHLPLCQYNGEDDTHCAIGIFATDHVFVSVDNERDFSGVLSLSLHLQAKYPDIAWDFWNDLQRISDRYVKIGRDEGDSLEDIRNKFKKALQEKYPL